MLCGIEDGDGNQSAGSVSLEEEGRELISLTLRQLDKVIIAFKRSDSVDPSTLKILEDVRDELSEAPAGIAKHLLVIQPLLSAVASLPAIGTEAALTDPTKHADAAFLQSWLMFSAGLPLYSSFSQLAKFYGDVFNEIKQRSLPVGMVLLYVIPGLYAYLAQLSVQERFSQWDEGNAFNSYLLTFAFSTALTHMVTSGSPMASSTINMLRPLWDTLFQFSNPKKNDADVIAQLERNIATLDKAALLKAIRETEEKSVFPKFMKHSILSLPLSAVAGLPSLATHLAEGNMENGKSSTIQTLGRFGAGTPLYTSFFPLAEGYKKIYDSLAFGTDKHPVLGNTLSKLASVLVPAALAYATTLVKIEQEEAEAAGNRGKAWGYASLHSVLLTHMVTSGVPFFDDMSRLYDKTISRLACWSSQRFPSTTVSSSNAVVTVPSEGALDSVSVA